MLGKESKNYMKGELREDFKDTEWITLFGSYIEGSLAVLIPVYMFSLGIDLEEVGLILAIAPFIFAISRLIMAMASDMEGVKPIFESYSFSIFLAPLIYGFYPTTLGFGIGKTLEGISRGAYWSVARTAAYKFGRKRDKSSSTILGIRYFSLGLGRIISLLAVAYVGFQNVFLLLSGLSLIVGKEALKIKERLRKITKNKARKELKDLLKIRKKEFYYAMIGNMIIASISIFSTNLLLIYLLDEIKKLGIEEIALLVGTVFGSIGITAYFLSKVEIKPKLLSIATMIYFLSVWLLMKQGYLLYISMVLLGGANAVFLRHAEKMMSKVVDKTEDVSLSIAILNFPLAIMLGILYLAVKQLVLIFGLYNLFIIFSVVSFITSLWAQKAIILKDEKNDEKQ